MPTYDYECPKGHRFEVFQKMTDDPVAECPECGAPASRKISGGAGFLFKGEGFYITDYRSEEYKKKASQESGSSKGAPAKDASSKSADSASSKDSGPAKSGGTSSTSSDG